MEHFQFDLPLEVRAAAGEDSDGRTLEGRIVPYDTEIQVGETRERFAKGVFADTVPVVVSSVATRYEPADRPDVRPYRRG